MKILPLVLVALSAVRLPAQVLELPAEVRLSGREVVLELHATTLRITLEEADAPTLKARRLDEGAAGTVALEVSSESDGVRVRRGEDEGEPLLVEVTLDPRAVIGVSGRGLDVTVQHLLPDEDVPVDAPRLRVEVEGSNVELYGVAGAALTATRGRLHLEGTRGALVLALDDVTGDVAGHRGRIELRGEKAELTLVGFDGEASWDLVASRLVARAGESALHGVLEGGSLELDEWRGKASIEGGGASIEARAAGAEGSELKLRGTELQVTVDGFEGVLDVELDGGSLAGGGLSGESRLVGRRQALIDLVDLDGPVSLELAGGASARLSDVPGSLTAELEDARLEVERIGRLAVKAVRSELFGSDLGRLDTVSVRDTALELDLSGIAHNPALALKGTSTGRIRLPSPCTVRVAGSRFTLEERVTVSGCELGGRPQGGVRPPPRPGEVVLVVALDELSALEVESVP